MKYIFAIFFLLPLVTFSQVKNIKPVQKTSPSKLPLLPGEFIITGDVKGFPDGTSIAFLNDQTGVPEKQAEIEKNKFVIKGKLNQPQIKGIIFNNAQPVVPLFLDDSRISITGTKDALDKLVIKGSSSNDQFEEYITAVKPYEKLFLPDAEQDSASVAEVKKISENFVKKYPSSFVSPLAIIRLYQVSQDGVKAEQLYNMLPEQVKSGDLGSYVNQQVQESKINPIGSTVTEFSQTDTTGKAISISSFKGKYVLVDFWASWCRPCRMENPNVVAAYNKFKDKNFTVLGVSLDQAKPAWIDAINMDGLTWNHVSDLKGWGNAVAAQFQIKSIPQNLLLDPDGKIIAKNLRGPVLEKKLTAILK